MSIVTIELPSDVFSGLRPSSPEEFACELRLAAALYWYSRGELSQGKAAEVAGMARVEFIDELARRKADAFAVDMNDLRKELEPVLRIPLEATCEISVQAYPCP